MELNQITYVITFDYNIITSLTIKPKLIEKSLRNLIAE